MYKIKIVSTKDHLLKRLQHISTLKPFCATNSYFFERYQSAQNDEIKELYEQLYKKILTEREPHIDSFILLWLLAYKLDDDQIFKKTCDITTNFVNTYKISNVKISLFRAFLYFSISMLTIPFRVIRGIKQDLILTSMSGVLALWILRNLRLAIGVAMVAAIISNQFLHSTSAEDVEKLTQFTAAVMSSKDLEDIKPKEGVKYLIQKINTLSFVMVFINNILPFVKYYQKLLNMAKSGFSIDQLQQEMTVRM